MTALAGQRGFSARTVRGRVSARLSVGILSLALALGVPLCQAAHSVVSAHHDDDSSLGSPDRETGQSLGVGQNSHNDDVCCHLSARESAIGKSPALLPHRTSASLPSAPPLSPVFVPVAYTLPSIHHIPPLTTPLARFTDKLVL